MHQYVYGPGSVHVDLRLADAMQITERVHACHCGVRHECLMHLLQVY